MHRITPQPPPSFSNRPYPLFSPRPHFSRSVSSTRNFDISRIHNDTFLTESGLSEHPSMHESTEGSLWSSSSVYDPHSTSYARLHSLEIILITFPNSRRLLHTAQPLDRMILPIIVGQRSNRMIVLSRLGLDQNVLILARRGHCGSFIRDKIPACCIHIAKVMFLCQRLCWFLPPE
jgi:hypothetical protein